MSLMILVGPSDLGYSMVLIKLKKCQDKGIPTTLLECSVFILNKSMYALKVYQAFNAYFGNSYEMSGTQQQWQGCLCAPRYQVCIVHPVTEDRKHLVCNTSLGRVAFACQAD